VNVKWGEGGYSEDLFIENLPVARDDQHIGALRLKGFNEGAVTGCFGLQDRDSLPISERGDRASLDRAPATSGEIRAGYDERELVPALCHGA
jgi:hypothetical protein